MITRSLPVRAAASVLVAGALLLGTSGCGLITTQATFIEYDPSDGIGADFDKLAVRNVLAMINDEGTALALSFTVVNPVESSDSLVVQIGDAVDEKFIVGGQDTLTAGGTDDDVQIIVENPDAVAGGLIEVYMQGGTAQGKVMLVPVLDSTHTDYASILP